MCRAKRGALQEFASWAESLLAPEAGWSTKAAQEELEAQIVGHTDRLIASKVLPTPELDPQTLQDHTFCSYTTMWHSLMMFMSLSSLNDMDIDQILSAR